MISKLPKLSTRYQLSKKMHQSHITRRPMNSRDSSVSSLKRIKRKRNSLKSKPLKNLNLRRALLPGSKKRLT